MKIKRYLALLAIAAACTSLVLVGTVLGYVGFEKSLDKQFQVFSQAVSRIQSQYVEKVDPKKLIYSGIDGMLRTLDPHSRFLDKVENKLMREDQIGKFGGIGVSFDIQEGVLVVISPIEGTPASQVGIQAGDRIIEIDGVSAIGITTGEVFDKLRGKKGTKVTIKVERDGVPEPLEFTIIRDEIPIKSVSYVYYLEPGTGYIRLNRFAEKTAQEFDEAIDQLKSQEQLQRLILDLRYNGGGLLDAAVDISDRFLPEDKLIVYTGGRIKGSDQEFYSTSTQTVPPEIPVIVLINNASASGSEIVAGAIQDWDRGILVGIETFGKGLVQSVYQLDEDCALIITTAKYYTPSGRCIQKPYKSTALKNTFEEEGKKPSVEEEKTYHTSLGRPVYGGGGIYPDIDVEQKEYLPHVTELLRQNAFFENAVHYVAMHPEIKSKTLEDLTINEEYLDDFIKYLEEKKLTFNEEMIYQEPEQILMCIKREVARVLWGQEEASKVGISEDVQLMEALKLFDLATELMHGVIPEQLQKQEKNPLEDKEKKLVGSSEDENSQKIPLDVY